MARPKASVPTPVVEDRFCNRCNLRLDRCPCPACGCPEYRLIPVVDPDLAAALADCAEAERGWGDYILVDGRPSVVARLCRHVRALVAALERSRAGRGTDPARDIPGQMMLDLTTEDSP
jgi:hypothetical protein